MENAFVIRGLLKSDTEIVLKLKHELWADTMLLWDTLGLKDTANLRMPLSVVCNCNYRN